MTNGIYDIYDCFPLLCFVILDAFALICSSITKDCVTHHKYIKMTIDNRQKTKYINTQKQKQEKNDIKIVTCIINSTNIQ